MTFKEFMYEKRNIIIVLISVLAVLILSIVSFSFKENGEMITASDESSGNESFNSEYTSDNNHFESSLDASEVFNDYSDVTENPDTDHEIPHGFIQNRFGITYVYGDSGFEQFSYKMTALDRYINSFNYLAEILPASTRLFNITAPVSSSFASIPYEIYTKDGFYNKSQSTFVSTVGAGINERFVNIPVVEVLKEHYNNGEYIFFRTDKNWTSLAAYYSYVEYCNSANIIPYQLEEFTKENVGEFLGSFYNATSSEEMRLNPDIFEVYSGAGDIATAMTVYDSGLVIKEYNLCGNDVTTENAYNYYLGTTAGRYEISSTANGGSLLVIGDTSVYPMLPFLSCHYTKIDYINPTEYQGHLAEFLKTHSYDDILTMCYSTNAINGDYIPTLNVLTGVNINE